MEEGAMAKELLPDALWARIAPLLPPEPLAFLQLGCALISLRFLG
jgi:hypothetical protein